MYCFLTYIIKGNIINLNSKRCLFKLYNWKVLILYKKIISFVLLTFLIFFFCDKKYVRSEQVLNEPNTSASSAILISANDNRILFSKNERERRSMASTTKIMTALLALEQADSNDKEIKITDEMVRVEGSSMGLLPGNVITISNIAKGMMMCSGNDAANSIAIAISGSAAEFSKLMNERAKQIGMIDTNFVTPSGLDSDEHYSTAYDMSVLGAYAMENKKFYDIVSQKSAKVNFIEPKEVHCYSNHNRLLKMYDGCVGIKTGFTSKSGRCLVSCAERNGVRLVAVTLNDRDDWKDHEEMFNYGFSKVKSIELNDSSTKLEVDVVGGMLDKVFAIGGTTSMVTLPNEDIDKLERIIEMPSFLYAPVCKGQIIGKIKYKLNDEVVAVNDLVASNDNKIMVKKSIIYNIKSFLFKLFN